MLPIELIRCILKYKPVISLDKVIEYVGVPIGFSPFEHKCTIDDVKKYTKSMLNGESVEELAGERTCIWAAIHSACTFYFLNNPNANIVIITGSRTRHLGYIISTLIRIMDVSTYYKKLRKNTPETLVLYMGHNDYRTIHFLYKAIPQKFKNSFIILEYCCKNVTFPESSKVCRINHYLD